MRLYKAIQITPTQYGVFALHEDRPPSPIFGATFASKKKAEMKACEYSEYAPDEAYLSRKYKPNGEITPAMALYKERLHEWESMHGKVTCSKVQRINA